MAEFSWIDQQAMTSGLTEQERGIFYLQYGSVQRDRTVLLLVSIFVGSFGVDRFLLNDIGIGVLKLLTGGLCGILWLIDIFLIMGKTDDYNRQKAHEILSGILANRAYAQQSLAYLPAAPSVPLAAQQNPDIARRDDGL